MRHYYDSRLFPFLSDLLFDQLLNFDWESSRKEIEEEKRKKKECRKENEKSATSGYLRVNDETEPREVKLYSPTFKQEDGGRYIYHTLIPKEVNPKDITISVTDRTFYLSYSYKNETGESSAALLETLPSDLDVDTMKAVVKNGNLTVTADPLPEPEEKEEDEEVEYEIEIDK